MAYCHVTATTLRSCTQGGADPPSRPLTPGWVTGQGRCQGQPRRRVLIGGLRWPVPRPLVVRARRRGDGGFAVDASSAVVGWLQPQADKLDGDWLKSSRRGTGQAVIGWLHSLRSQTEIFYKLEQGTYL